MYIGFFPSRMRAIAWQRRIIFLQLRLQQHAQDGDNFTDFVLLHCLFGAGRVHSH